VQQHGTVMLFAHAAGAHCGRRHQPQGKSHGSEAGRDATSTGIGAVGNGTLTREFAAAAVSTSVAGSEQ